MSVISIEHSEPASSLNSDGLPTRRPTGFAIPGYASRAAVKGQQMGLTHRWTPDEARRYSGAGVQARRVRREQREVGVTP